MAIICNGVKYDTRHVMYYVKCYITIIDKFIENDNQMALSHDRENEKKNYYKYNGNKRSALSNNTKHGGDIDRYFCAKKKQKRYNNNNNDNFFYIGITT